MIEICKLFTHATWLAIGVMIPAHVSCQMQNASDSHEIKDSGDRLLC